MNTPPTLLRRRVLLVCSAALVACERSPATAQTPTTASAPMSDEDLALKHKFKGLDGGELFVDAFGEKHGVNIFDESGRRFFVRATVSARNNSLYSYGAKFGVPKTLRVEWRDPSGDFRMDGLQGEHVGGVLIGNYTVPVAARIPDELLDDLRKNGGSFRLKIRIHDDGPLIGWDIRRAYGSATDDTAFHHAGGDFREAAPLHSKLMMLKGWYIHPKTKARIETDF